MKTMTMMKKWVAVAVLGVSLGAGLAHAGKRKYTAVCNTTHGLSGSWWGSDRDNRADADADAAAHKKSWPNHSPDVFDRND